MTTAPHGLNTVARFVGQVVARLAKTTLLAVLVAGVPYGLITQIGAPAPTTRPTADGIVDLLTAPVTDQMILQVLAAATWILWAALVASIGAELVALVRGVSAPRLGPIAPLQGFAGWLVTGITAGVLIAAPSLTVPGPAMAATTTSTQNTSPHPANFTPVAQATSTAPPSEGVTRPASSSQAAAAYPVYRVAPGDWLGAIAERYLGDFDRYHDIAALNPGLIPRGSGPDGPDFIYPNERYRLPADARDRGPRPHANGTFTPIRATRPAHTGTTPAPAIPQPTTAPQIEPPEPSTPRPRTPTASPRATPPPVSTDDATITPTTAPSTDDDGVVPEPSTPPTASATPHQQPAPEPTATDAPADRASPRHDDGVDLPGGWVTVPLAAMIVAAGAMVWKQRRRRYRLTTSHNPIEPTEPDLRPLPLAVGRMRRAVREQAPELIDPPPPQPTVTDYAAGDDLVLPPIGPSGAELAGLPHPIPAGGLGLTGPGAHAAARALLIATLSSGGPADPDARGFVIAPADTLNVLVGEQTPPAGFTPRLIVTTTLADALTRADQLMIERRRLLQEHQADDLAGMRATDPYHPPMPPVLLLAEAPPAALRARFTATVHLGTRLQLDAVLLGEWPRGETVSVDADGHLANTDRRLAVLDEATTQQLLDVLHEAHIGTASLTPESDAGSTVDPAEPQPSAIADTDAPQPAAPSAQPATAQHREPDDAGTQPTTVPAPAPDGAALDCQPRSQTGPVRIQLLGTPTILDRNGAPVTGLRSNARQLLVYLAVHRTGADLSDIMEAIWPTATVRRAGERLSTEVSDLRGRIRAAAGDAQAQPVINTGGRYHLNPDILEIDLWKLNDALARAATASEPGVRAAALREAIDLHTGMLADGHDYEWIEQPREYLRRVGVQARMKLAQLVTDMNPDAGSGRRDAADLIGAAAALDPYNEGLAQNALRAFAAIRDTERMRRQLESLREALADIDEEPSAETLALMPRLERQATSRQNRPGDDHETGSG